MQVYDFWGKIRQRFPFLVAVGRNSERGALFGIYVASMMPVSSNVAYFDGNRVSFLFDRGSTNMRYVFVLYVCACVLLYTTVVLIVVFYSMYLYLVCDGSLSVRYHDNIHSCTYVMEAQSSV